MLYLQQVCARYERQWPCRQMQIMPWQTVSEATPEQAAWPLVISRLYDLSEQDQHK